ncbi:hypothetical protein BP6252_05158 [Coleophoma cylindrospora]|uniref:Fe2OG dioxygenase domain-containing protein n=1 Tax=Coleophoma cylindrospora TaxID=1849047 RepID=A0A3D8RSY0_9HELO|nr:hypothetical protein BP6252_05158 [Coleophoma cylindrospora]
MAMSDVLAAPGSPSVFHAMNSPRLAPSTKNVQDGLKRSFAKYLAADHAWDSDGLENGKLFNPNKHVVYNEPTNVLTMEDIGYTASNGVSPVAVSDPFALFSEEAIDIMRNEILDPEVLEKYSYTSDIAPKQIRGYAPKHGKFIFEAWKSPAVLSIISKIAGVDLVPVMDYEIGHVNLSVPAPKKFNADGSEVAPKEDDDAIVGWHRDSYPFVCVLMMSDTTGMVGGETALKTADGVVKKVRGPTKGCAVVLQGRYIDHQALRAYGGQERITMVTSFRPRSPRVRDDTVLNTVRPISNLSDLYGQTVEYQLENAETRIRRMLKTVRDSMKAGATDVAAIKAFLDFEITAMSHLNKEIVPENMVKMGSVADICEEERLEAASKRAKLQ